MRKITKFPRLTRRSLHEKTLIFLCLTLVSLIGVVYLASSEILVSSLKTAEEQSARQSLQGILNVVAKDQEAFTARFNDWSAWDDFYAFVKDRNEAFIKSNLIVESLSNLRINFIGVVNIKGQIIFSKKIDFKQKVFQPLSSDLSKFLAPNSLLITYPKSNRKLTGVVLSSEGAMLVTAHPILPSHGKGQVRGSIIFGRYLNSDAIDDLSKITRFSIQQYPLNQTKVPADIQQIRSILSPQNPIFIQPLNQKLLVGYVLLSDVAQNPALILKVEIPREVYQQVESSQRNLMISIVLLGCLFGFLTLLLLKKTVLDRLSHLSRGVRQIQTSQNLSLRLPAVGHDEISSLTDQINQLLETLEKSQGEVNDALAQVTQTNGELHNTVERLQTEIEERHRVEAVLRESEEKLKTQAQCLEQTLGELQQTQLQLVQSEKMSSLGQLVAGIAHEINNPVNFIYGNLRHAKLYIHDLVQVVQLYRQEYPDGTPKLEAAIDASELEFVMTDLPQIFDSMEVGAERIRDIVNSLRIFSRLDEAEVKAVNLHDGLDSTLLILQRRLEANSANPGILVVRNYADLPFVECYAGQMNQVFMHILVNAIDAIEQARETKQAAKRSKDAGIVSRIAERLSSTITIQTRHVAMDLIEIRISDSGVGMSEEVKSRLFDPFFTTKPIGKGTGLGLSISYQVVVAKHQGTLECHSILGKGTEFVITIPRRMSSSARSIPSELMTKKND